MYLTRSRAKQPAMTRFASVALQRFLSRRCGLRLIQRCNSTLVSEKHKTLIVNRKMEATAIARPDPVVMKIDSPEFHSIFTQELRDLIALFKKHDYEIRIAGGAVRDILMKINPKDVDFATTATPAQMKELFNKENIRMVNMNGEKHGTITPRINDKENFEITTLRIDIATDGRHAEVVHTTDWLLDANRRDLTINSMFLGFDGTLYDYFYGYEDVQKRRVAFVGDPDQRIKEDYLRILRYFRFYGRIANDDNVHDDETIRVITKNADGMARISGERIWQEWKKILTGNFGCELTTRMIECNLASHIGLPKEPNVARFKEVYQRVKALNGTVQPITVIAALLHTPEDAVNLNLRLKLTVFERELCYFLVQNRDEFTDVEDLLPYQQLCFQTISSVAVKKQYVEELLKYSNKRALYEQLASWTIPRFPLNGNDLIKNGAPTGSMLGKVMNRLKVIWAENGFNMSEEELLKHLPEVIKQHKK